MRFCSLGSGSEGNGLVVEAGTTRVLLDCGFGLADCVARLARRGVQASDLAGIVVTHEHSDHIGGVGRLARKFGLPVWLTAGTRVMAQDLDGVDVRVIDSHARFAVDALDIQPFPVPHDAREPVQFVFGDGNRSLGVLTDLGCVTPHVEAMLDGVDALVLECNHDADMLENGPYPVSLKRRVGGRFGHLENSQAAALLDKLKHDGLQCVMAAHVSKKNNTNALAQTALANVLGCNADEVRVACQTSGFDWIRL
ncbi:MAG: MBL fold metallo-hydrolase [Hydrogenophilales bacterium 16-64-46]|nr:MAG: MBL fold metallo-hydrolase [Hydrogenophilales bacterium 12-64-13]OYZ06341.1 MAG: MBL fold metallo-hydrolase [Hydrogenophilales bacterium 16-64-46]OZA38760.1 MAG: MBL fold metallo-hydrolase [Hydrogenophilales bacterium 17-64-34]HQS99618.1 MBL fold metallo-hydrolase [Thiobacillus sp.]